MSDTEIIDTNKGQTEEASEANRKLASDFRQYLKDKIKDEISSWSKRDIYAVYIGVSGNNVVDEPLNMPFLLEIGFGFGGRRNWHLAAAINCSRKYLIETSEERDGLVRWLKSIGAENIGQEDKDSMYNDKMEYIGKGPGGMYETLQAIVGIFTELFAEGFISEKFGKDIPVIFDNLETVWYCIEATEKANPDGIADEFLTKMRTAAGSAGDMFKVPLPMLFISSIIRAAAFFPCALFSSVMVLIAGGIHIPLTVGGAVKGTIEALVILKRIIYCIGLGKTYRADGQQTAEAEPVLRLVLLTAADIIAAAAVLFSCMLIPERAAAAVCVLGAVVYAIADSFVLRSANKKLFAERGAELAKAFSDVRDAAGSEDGDTGDGNG